MNDKYQIQRLSDENFQLFYELFIDVFQSNISYRFLYNKYDTRYLGGDLRYLGYLAIDHKGKADSYCGCIPFKFLIKGKEYIGAHSCDHMTRKEARGQGLFVNLNNASDALCQRLNASFIFGFPNQNNHPILVKHAKWIVIDFMNAFSIPITTLPLSSAINRVSFLKGGYNKLSHSFMQEKKTDRFIAREDWAGIIRDKAFYKYKSFSQNNTYQFKHGLVWLKINGPMYIGDIQLNSSGNFLSLIAELKATARLIGVNKIIFLGSSDLELTKLFLANYKMIKGNGVGVKALQQNFKLNLTDLRFTYGDYDTF